VEAGSMASTLGRCNQSLDPVGSDAGIRRVCALGLPRTADRLGPSYSIDLAMVEAGLKDRIVGDCG
jgi:hypothetical protein